MKPHFILLPLFYLFSSTIPAPGDSQKAAYPVPALLATSGSPWGKHVLYSAYRPLSTFLCRPPRPTKDRALFFAVDNYTLLLNLSNPIKNATDLAEELKTRFGFTTEIVKNPTRIQIKQKLEYYHSQYQSGAFDPEGQLLIFFSGHGDFDESAKNGFFIPQDGDPNDLLTTGVPYHYWRPYINNINCKHLLIAIDACYSGTFDWQIAMRDIEGRFERPDELEAKERILAEHDKRKTRLYLVSGAREKTPDKSGFAKKFLEGLREGGYQNGLLSAKELYANYIQHVRPRPVFGEFGDDEAGSSFLFIREDNGVNTADLRQDLDAWKRAQDLNTLYAYQYYLRRFSAGEFRVQAEAKVQELEREEALNRDLSAWKRAKDLDNKQVYEEYLRNFPDGEFHNQAKAKVQEFEREAASIRDREAWQRVKGLDNKQAYEEYLRDFPNGEFHDQAKAKVQKLEREAASIRDREAWQRVKGLDNKQAYEEYLRDFPNGEFRNLAEKALNKKKSTPVDAGSAKTSVLLNEEMKQEKEKKDRGLFRLFKKVAPTITSTLPRDPAGQIYKTIELNGKLWLAENLNYDIGKGSWRYWRKTANGERYGRLYTWQAAQEACQALGNGWKLPTDWDWKGLALSFGGYYDWSTGMDIGDPEKSYKALLKGGKSGLAALLGGWRNSRGNYYGSNVYGGYWSAWDQDTQHAWNYYFINGKLNRDSKNKLNGFSCRCLKDAPSDGVD